MRGLLAQVGMGLDFGAVPLYLFALMYAGVAFALWLVLVVSSAVFGPHLSVARRLLWLVGHLLWPVAAALWAVCAWGYADGGQHSEVFRAVLPYAVALTACAVSVAAGRARGSRAEVPGR